MTFIPVPMPKTVCRTIVCNKIVQLEVFRTFSGRGMGMNITSIMVIIIIIITAREAYIYNVMIIHNVSIVQNVIIIFIM